MTETAPAVTTTSTTTSPQQQGTSLLSILALIGAFSIPVAGIIVAVIAKRDIAAKGGGSTTMAQAAFVIGIVLTILQVIGFALWLLITVGSIVIGIEAPTFGDPVHR